MQAWSVAMSCLTVYVKKCMQKNCMHQQHLVSGAAAHEVKKNSFCSTLALPFTAFKKLTHSSIHSLKLVPG